MKTFIVDSFTTTAYKGNPAGVCFPECHLEDTQMLMVAQELGLSETAFVTPTHQPGTYDIRYFSPKKEIPLCGHATLASAKVLFEDKGQTAVSFNTIEHLQLNVTKRGEEIIMEFPVYPTSPVSVSIAMLKALGLTNTINTVFNARSKIILIEIDHTEVLARLRPDFTALVKTHDEINGVLVTARSIDTEHDYHYRYFWPWAGTNEDPVTGGVQTFLAPYWSDRLGKKKMRAFQSSSRTGYMNLELKDQKVLLSSQAVIILKGDLMTFN
jgi:PhzF family phenazine biosynthesis protein